MVTLKHIDHNITVLATCCGLKYTTPVCFPLSPEYQLVLNLGLNRKEERNNNYDNNITMPIQYYTICIYRMYKMGKTLIMTKSEDEKFLFVFISIMPRAKLGNFILLKIYCFVFVCYISPEL